MNSRLPYLIALGVFLILLPALPILLKILKKKKKKTDSIKDETIDYHDSTSYGWKKKSHELDHDYTKPQL